MKVGLVTTWDERCGVAEYSRDIVASKLDDVEYEIFARDSWSESHLVNNDCQILHVNHEPGLFDRWLTVDMLNRLKASGKKLVLTLNASHSGNNRSQFTSVFNKVVVHEKTEDNFTYIPVGIHVCHIPQPALCWDVGWVGFPFSWKGMDLIAQATAELGLSCLLIMAESPHVEVKGMRAYLESVNPKATVVTDYLPVSEIQADYFSRCCMTAFPYDGGNYGTSGAARMGVGVGHPVILTRHRQFRDLLEYPDEFHIMTERNVAQLIACINEVRALPKYPKQVLEGMSWTKSAAMYKQVYEEALSA